MPESVFCNSELLTQISSMCFDDNGNLYASNFGGGGIIKIDSSGSTSSLLTDLGTSDNYISGIVYNSGYLYASVFASTGNIYQVDVSTGDFVILSTILGNNISAIGITYYGGYIYVPVLDANSIFFGIYQIDILNTINVLFISQSVLILPQYFTTVITVDNNGNFYIYGNNGIIKFDSSGNVISANFILNIKTTLYLK